MTRMSSDVTKHFHDKYVVHYYFFALISIYIKHKIYYVTENRSSPVKFFSSFSCE